MYGEQLLDTWFLAIMAQDIQSVAHQVPIPIVRLQVN